MGSSKPVVTETALVKLRGSENIIDKNVRKTFVGNRSGREVREDLGKNN